MLQKILSCALTLALSLTSASAVGPLVRTTGGFIRGSQVAPGVLAWKGIPFAVPPVGEKRWTAPVLNSWKGVKNTTTLSVACVQQFVAGSDLAQALFNNPPIPEGEDCLSINVFAPARPSASRAVLLWIYGGGFVFGGNNVLGYDGTSFAQNQNVVLVTINYRTNIFGFPNAPEVPLEQVNLGLLDQQLALNWTQKNIARFGGDPRKVTIFGQSAGSASVEFHVQKFAKNPPFHAAIQQSGALTAGRAMQTRDFTVWNIVSTHFGCGTTSGDAQLACMRAVPSSDIKDFIQKNSLPFGPQADGGVTVSTGALQRIAQKQVARVPIMIGNTKDDDSVFVAGQNNLTAFLAGGISRLVPAAVIRAAYPVPEKFATDALAIIAIGTDTGFGCPSSLTAQATVNASVAKVFRYVYGPVFEEFQAFPNAGSFHATEIPLVFGTLSDQATDGERQLSRTMQTIWANFAKNPNASPAPNWPVFKPGAKTVAALAFNNNFALRNVVETSLPSRFDTQCTAIWNKVLDPVDFPA